MRLFTYKLTVGEDSFGNKAQFRGKLSTPKQCFYAHLEIY